MKSKASSAPTQNMSSERALGCLDRMWRQAPNDTMGFLSGKLKAKLNDTLGWLEAKPSFETDKLIQFVITEANGDRAKKLLEHRQLLSEIGERRLNVEAQRAKTTKNYQVKQIKLFFKTKGVGRLSVEFKNPISDFLCSPDTVVGALTIYKTDEGEKYACIQHIKKDLKLKLSFRELHETESSSIDKVVASSKFYADVVLGQVVF
ncbi:hypothetical protein ElyMa_004690800 [Elysia marginata]|uniref:Uncharacterized protein n=1 Tax=Elysia marginata TaxID=1093978 RepID=A0AAV4I693_9GAST|nr:hypothetical protein ElyMa_004690800 [Elysia marginata]